MDKRQKWNKNSTWRTVIERECAGRFFVQIVQTNCIRIHGKDKIDIYPQGERYHNKTTDERGDIPDIIQFVRDFVAKHR